MGSHISAGKSKSAPRGWVYICAENYSIYNQWTETGDSSPLSHVPQGKTAGHSLRSACVRATTPPMPRVGRTLFGILSLFRHIQIPL